MHKYQVGGNILNFLNSTADGGFSLLNGVFNNSNSQAGILGDFTSNLGIGKSQDIVNWMNAFSEDPIKQIQGATALGLNSTGQNNNLGSVDLSSQRSLAGGGIGSIINASKNIGDLRDIAKGVKGRGLGMTGNAIGMIGSVADMASSFIPGLEDQYAGPKGDITQTVDSAYDNVSNTLMAIPGVGAIAGGAMKIGGFVGDILDSAGIGTSKMTTKDAILDSNFLKLTPFGLINALGASKTSSLIKNEQAFAQVGSSYGGTSSDVDEAIEKANKRYGLYSRKEKREAESQIGEARRQQDIMTNIANTAADRQAITQSMSAINSNRRALAMQGGYNQADVKVGRSGMSLDLIAKAKKVLHESRKLKGGGQITPTEILLVVPEFQDGGQINKKSRTLQELIEYAKKENPRFIQRMSEPPRGIDFVDDEGKQARGSHYMEWSTDDNGNAIIYPRIQEVDKELKFFNSSDAYNRAMENKNYLIMTPEEAKLFFAEDSIYGTAYKSGWPQFFGKFQQGGSINIIPEGALHAHKHNMDMEGITPKGIPVVSNKEGGEVEQQAEIEREEIIFRLEVTKKLEELEEKYYDEETSQREKDECALEAGKLLVEEILYNTQDNTNKLL